MAENRDDSLLALAPTLAESRDKWWQNWEDANPNSPLGFDIEQGWDSAWDCVEQTIAAHDREVAAKAWERAEFAFERAHNADMLEPWGHMPDNPYRGTPEQEVEGAEIDEAEVVRIATVATAHNSGQTVYEVSRASGILRVVMSSWPRAKEAYTALAGAGYTVAQDGDHVMVLAAPTESEGTP